MTPVDPIAKPRPSLLRRVLLLMLLVMAFVASDRLYQAADNWRPVTTGEPGEVLLARSFDALLDDWQQAPGRNSHLVENGRMRVTVTTPNVIYSAASPIVADFDVRVTLTAVGGVEDNEGAGIIFRLQEQRGQCDMPLRTLCDLAQLDLLSIPLRLIFRPADQNPQGYYVFLVSTDGYYSLWRRDPQGSGLSNVTVWHNGHGLINTGLNVANRIRIVGRGDTFQFNINGQQVELCVPLEGQKPTGSADNCQGERTRVWRDSAFATGKLGVVVNTYQKPGTVVDFDNFSVISPDDGAGTPIAEA